MTDQLDHFLAKFGEQDRAHGVTLALRALCRRRAHDWVLEAELAWEVHTRAHWQAVPAPDGRAYESEEAYWVDVLQLDSWRSVTRRLQIGRALVEVPPEARARVRMDLATIGVAKAAILAPLFESWAEEAQPWQGELWQRWMGTARVHPPDLLQRVVSDALEAKPRGLGEPGRRFLAAILRYMPDQATREEVEEVFRAGMRLQETPNPVAVFLHMIAEVKVGWLARVPEGMRER